jgi:hypothetical protein
MTIAGLPMTPCTEDEAQAIKRLDQYLQALLTWSRKKEFAALQTPI